MAQLPLFKDPNQQFMLLQTKWKSQLDPVLASPLFAGNLLSNISLINGVTVINHLLGRMQIGWFLTDLNISATTYRSQPFNDKTLTLTCNGAATVNIWVF